MPKPNEKREVRDSRGRLIGLLIWDAKRGGVWQSNGCENETRGEEFDDTFDLGTTTTETKATQAVTGWNRSRPV